MKITVLGASGNMGRRITCEASARGHQVTAVMRSTPATNSFPDGVAIVQADANVFESVLPLFINADLVITATRPQTGKEQQLVQTTRVLLKAAEHSSTRLLISGGAATLTIPGSNGTLLLDELHKQSAPCLPIALACADQHRLCQSSMTALWTYASPPAQLVEGQRTGQFRLGLDEMLTDEQGNSSISMEDFAVALLEEAENPRHLHKRFTAAY